MKSIGVAGARSAKALRCQPGAGRKIEIVEVPPWG